MKYIIFNREDSNFKDILTDPNLKSIVRFKLAWRKHLKIGIPLTQAKLLSYIELKYGDNIVNRVCRDFSPVPQVDYSPKRR